MHKCEGLLETKLLRYIMHEIGKKRIEDVSEKETHILDAVSKSEPVLHKAIRMFFSPLL